MAEEAAKLLGALSGWASTHGGDLGHGLSDIASAAIHDVDEHIATGAPSAATARCAGWCTSCARPAPRCAPTSSLAGTSLMQAAAALLATAVPDDTDRGSGGVEQIDLDDEWPDGP